MQACSISQLFCQNIKNKYLVPNFPVNYLVFTDKCIEKWKPSSQAISLKFDSTCKFFYLVSLSFNLHYIFQKSNVQWVVRHYIIPFPHTFSVIFAIFACSKPLKSLCKIQVVVYYQCCILIGWATSRLFVIAH